MNTQAFSGKNNVIFLNNARMIIMKKLIGITGVILIACICISSLYPMPTAAQTSTVPTATALAEPTAKSVENYIIKSENNVIVVYKAGESTPYIVTEARTDNLPKGDILRLKSGVEVDGEKNLKKMLEDYCS